MSGVRLRNGAEVEDRRLDRLVSPDWRHYERFPLTAQTVPAEPTPVVIGVNWYADFDRPQLDGRMYWIGRGDLGRIRGGHCVCIKNNANDPLSWWDYYDQGAEGACVGFGSSRMMSLMNRRRFAARWLYHECQKIDPWPGGAYEGASPFYEGTDVRSALEVLRSRGHRWFYRGLERPEDAAEGIEVYRWANTVDQVLEVIQHATATRLGAVPILNSWGREYPHYTWMPGETLQRLIDEDGEVGLVTDR